MIVHKKGQITLDNNACYSKKYMYTLWYKIFNEIIFIYENNSITVLKLFVKIL